MRSTGQDENQLGFPDVAGKEKEPTWVPASRIGSVTQELAIGAERCFSWPTVL